MTFDSIYYNVRNVIILDGIFVQVKPGEVCAILGKNGSGKSTLIKIGAGILAPTSGNVFFNGEFQNLRQRRDLYKKIAYLSQESFLPRDLTVSRVCQFFQMKIETGPLGELFSPLNKAKIRDLSGGERRLLELQLILSLNRPFVLLDEPFTGVSPKIIEEMICLIDNERRRGKGILITDHYYRYLLELLDSAYYLRNGKCYRIEKPIEAALIEHGYLR